MDKFQLVTGSRELLDLVQPLWEKLNKHHEANSRNFSDRFKNFKFEDRKSRFTQDNSLQVKIDLIKNMEKGLYVGYCITTIDKELTGEIESIFVEQDYRKCGLGDSLMKSALDWLKSNQVKKKIIGVTEGNEHALEFYRRYGFYKRKIILEHIEE
jgi:ribosomal protein S18 acetylase RimI-like enzyme